MSAAWVSLGDIRDEPDDRPVTLESIVAFLRANQPDWFIDAECRKPGNEGISFFPERYDIAGLRLAQSVCAVCDVSTDCESYARSLRPKAHGVWGGKGSDQLHRRVPKGERRQRRERILEMHAAGATNTEIAAALKISLSAVATYLRRSEPRELRSSLAPDGADDLGVLVDVAGLVPDPADQDIERVGDVGAVVREVVHEHPTVSADRGEVPSLLAPRDRIASGPILEQHRLRADAVASGEVVPVD